VIDFEYAAPNPRGYDIANHFHEWRANYHHPTHSHSLQPHFPYPTAPQRSAFYRGYLSIEVGPDKETLGHGRDVAQDRVDALEREVRLWSPACSIFWSLWGIIQAEEQVDALSKGCNSVDFDYLVGR
jgi:choline kinase